MEYVVTSPEGKEFVITAPEGASEDEILAYAQQNMPKAAQSSPQQMPLQGKQFNDLTPEDRKQIQSGIGNQVGAFIVGQADARSFGFGDELAAGIGSWPALLTRKVTVKDAYLKNLARIREGQKKQKEQNPGAFLAGQLYGGIKGAQSIAGTAPAKAVAAYLGTGGLGARALKAGVAGAVPSALYGFASGEGQDARMQGAGTGAATGAAFGAALPVAGAAVKSVVSGKQALAPKLIEDAPKVADLARKYSIPLGLDDISDSGFYKTLISEGKTLPASGAAKVGDAQRKAFTKAVGKSIGADADKLTPEVIANRFDDLGKQFDEFFEGKSIDLGKDYGLGLRVQDFMENTADNYGSEGKAALDKWMTRINGALKENGSISGDALSAVRKRANAVARGAGNPEVASVARDIENFIIDTVADSPAAKDAFRKTKYQYKNLIAIEPLVQKSQIEGQVSPAQLLNRVRQVYGRSFTKGDAGELGDLANIGQFIKESIPNSGTSQRTLARNILTGNAAGALPTAIFGGPLAALAQLGASGGAIAINRSLQKSNMNPDKIARAIGQIGTKKESRDLYQSALKNLAK